MCNCDLNCNSQYWGHTCTLEPGHLGPHSCHGRVFRVKPRVGDIVWRDEDADDETNDWDGRARAL